MNGHSFRPGDVVKLTHRFALVLMRTPRCRVDWVARRGLVKWANNQSVYIVWDGRSSGDLVPLGGVEVAA